MDLYGCIRLHAYSRGSFHDIFDASKSYTDSLWFVERADKLDNLLKLSHNKQPINKLNHNEKRINKLVAVLLEHSIEPDNSDH
ncbi:hypothetical protein AMS68_001077 [Peltaster fructicola]|uniref:Uncharacterized protein n=1 Tax=Peltaster fructicola TaxID=286661 RepID=A0A6H0XM34_9PEZI|nr:hypothetical protein AMS68_001077 [Peltaster fructicola]